ncbi:hypothetical protein CBW16_13050 [Flavobacteriaceae bacterium JJC]|nr:hypothetical protein CBW16_13050 [Flavobacteriaceae bacterium JJC]
MQDLLEKCLYYKGEESCPAELKALGYNGIWYYEMLWVERDDLRDENGFNMLEYKHYGLTPFNENDGTPMTLKALLFNRHMHWTGGWGPENDVKSFKQWYLENYLAKRR